MCYFERSKSWMTSTYKPGCVNEVYMTVLPPMECPHKQAHFMLSLSNSPRRSSAISLYPIVCVCSLKPWLRASKAMIRRPVSRWRLLPKEVLRFNDRFNVRSRGPSRRQNGCKWKVYQFCSDPNIPWATMRGARPELTFSEVNSS